MNKWIGIGILGKDPELNTTPNGTSVCKFSIAVQRPFKDAEGNRAVDWFNIVAWREKADVCHKYLKKGSKCGVVGNIQMRTYKDKDGNNRTSIEVVAEEVEFLTTKTESEALSPTENKTTKQKIAALEPDDSEDLLPF